MTHDKKPTPKPDMILPNTMTSKEVAKVWTAPPTEKMTAPQKRVLRRPKMSPTLPAAKEVTVVYSEQHQQVYW